VKIESAKYQTILEYISLFPNNVKKMLAEIGEII